MPAERLTLAQQNALPWSEQCANQLDRAAYLFGNVDNAALQQQIVRVLYPTADFHSRPHWGGRRGREEKGGGWTRRAGGQWVSGRRSSRGCLEYE